MPLNFNASIIKYNFDFKQSLDIISGYLYYYILSISEYLYYFCLFPIVAEFSEVSLKTHSLKQNEMEWGRERERRRAREKLFQTSSSVNFFVVRQNQFIN